MSLNDFKFSLISTGTYVPKEPKMAEQNDEIKETGVRFANDLSDELKARIKEEAAKRVDELLELTEFSMGNIVQLAGVSHSSVKSRAKTLSSAADIITAILNGERANGGTKKAPSTESIKSFLDSLSAEDRAKFLAELGIVG